MDLTRIKKNLKEEHPNLSDSVIDKLAEEAERKVEGEGKTKRNFYIE